MTDREEHTGTRGGDVDANADLDDSEKRLTAHPIEPSAPEEFGLVQAWWGNGKGKTTAALGLAFRAAGHGYRVHVLQFLKGGTESVEDVRGEYNAMAMMPGITYENTGHYGWHGFLDGTADDEHEAKARGALARARELLESARTVSLSEPLALEGPPEDGMHMLVLDEVLYAVDRDLLSPEDLLELIDDKPENLELICTGSHNRPNYLTEHAELISQVKKEKHPLEGGYPARKGTEF
ncbi:cob(I)alamin adenosyltransferase [Halalkaliarchaeum desulfuricum]|uniref:Cob(I)alamin adenosyltransferase n=1 Tax=Halalkaliarchaeum desulfuricum TaxID=2055893 RepID=A0A343TKG1_9EURY|nr:cob(I)yrinic acid a,c-diamide adenosyltransferase [Halalkaliarchaeum desulfuricum]AUX09583.1 cob(I)alamin adenosyltransferase [Halalkaliarchaeum desulfuricum]